MAVETITLRDENAGSQATILAGFGFNCFSFQAVDRGERIELLWAADDFASGNGRASASGIPILFPFPGRIRGGQFSFDGRDYTIPAGDGRGNAIHGFVLDRPWKVAEQTANRVVGEFTASAVDPAILTMWPSDFRLIATYSLEGNRLRSEFRVENPGRGRLPFGLGTHPYFRVPLGAAGKANDCRIQVPAKSYWELVELLPTGKTVAATGKFGLASGMAFGDTQFDDVFGGLTHERGVCTTSIRDPATNRTLEMTFDDGFRECVVYNPPHRQAICLEPYTCVPDPFTLGESGIETGLRTLGSGEHFTAWVEMALV